MNILVGISLILIVLIIIIYIDIKKELSKDKVRKQYIENKIKIYNIILIIIFILNIITIILKRK